MWKGWKYAAFSLGADSTYHTDYENSKLLSIYSQNINGDLSVKLLSPDFIKTFCDHDVVLFQETHIWPEEEESTVVPIGFYMLALSRKHRADWQHQGGGVLALVMEGLLVKKSQLSAPDILILDLGRLYIINVRLQTIKRDSQQSDSKGFKEVESD